MAQHLADFDGDGFADNFDLVGASGFLAAWASAEDSVYGSASYDHRADWNGDHAVNVFDVYAFSTLIGSSSTQSALGLSSSGLSFRHLSDTPIGYAGYVYRPELAWEVPFDPGPTDPASACRYTDGFWPARHRFYDPELGRWITRDPAGYVVCSSTPAHFPAVCAKTHRFFGTATGLSVLRRGPARSGRGCSLIDRVSGFSLRRFAARRYP